MIEDGTYVNLLEEVLSEKKQRTGNKYIVGFAEYDDYMNIEKELRKGGMSWMDLSKMTRDWMDDIERRIAKLQKNKGLFNKFRKEYLVGRWHDWVWEVNWEKGTSKKVKLDPKEHKKQYKRMRAFEKEQEKLRK